MSKPFGLARLMELKSYRGGGKELCGVASGSYKKDGKGTVEASNEACASVEHTVGSNVLPLSFSVSPSITAEIDGLKEFLESSGVGRVFGPAKLGGGISAKVTIEVDCGRPPTKGEMAKDIFSAVATLPKRCPAGQTRPAKVILTVAVGLKAGNHDLTFTVTGTRSGLVPKALLDLTQSRKLDAAAKLAAAGVTGTWQLTLKSTSGKQKSMGDSSAGSVTVGFTRESPEKTLCSGKIERARDLRDLLRPAKACGEQALKGALAKK